MRDPKLVRTKVPTNYLVLKTSSGKFKYGEQKPIKKNHVKEFGGRDAPEASQGQTRDVPGTPGTFGPDLCVNQC